jgi:Helicase associated domain
VWDATPNNNTMNLSLEERSLESSIYHYFLWQEAKLSLQDHYRQGVSPIATLKGNAGLVKEVDGAEENTKDSNDSEDSDSDMEDDLEDTTNVIQTSLHNSEIAESNIDQLPIDSNEDTNNKDRNDTENIVVEPANVLEENTDCISSKSTDQQISINHVEDSKNKDTDLTVDDTVNTDKPVLEPSVNNSDEKESISTTVIQLTEGENIVEDDSKIQANAKEQTDIIDQNSTNEIECNEKLSSNVAHSGIDCEPKSKNNNTTTTNVTESSLSPTRTGVTSTTDRAKYRRVLDVLEKEFKHVTEPYIPGFPQLVPEVYSRWTMYIKLFDEIAALKDAYLELLMQKDAKEQNDDDDRKSKKRGRDGNNDEGTKKLKRKKRKKIEDSDDFTEDVKEYIAHVQQENQKKMLQLEARLQRTQLNAKNRVVDVKSKYQQIMKEKLEAQEQLLKEKFESQANNEKKLPNQQLLLIQQHQQQEQRKKEVAGLPALPRRDSTWEHFYAKLVAFRDQHGNCNVPKHFSNNPSLGQWVFDQRKLYNQRSSELTFEMIDKLNIINFLWDPPPVQVTKTFEMRLDECHHFYQKYGHLNIPRPSNEKNPDGTEPTEEDKRFRTWAQGIRGNYKKIQDGKSCAKLTASKIRQLDEIGFVWGTEQRLSLDDLTGREGFHHRLELLKKVKESCGSCCDTKMIKKTFPDCPELVTWVTNQRKMYKRWQRGESTTMTDERRRLLSEIGFFDSEDRRRKPKGRNANNLADSDEDSISDMSAV